jgi:hypothetical protein
VKPLEWAAFEYVAWGGTPCRGEWCTQNGYNAAVRCMHGAWIVIVKGPNSHVATQAQCNTLEEGKEMVMQLIEKALAAQ